MSEFVLFVKDRWAHGDMTMPHRVWQRGDVVEVYADGFMERCCGHQESMVRQHDFWRVLLLPNVPLALGRLLEAEEPVGSILTSRQMNHKRLHRINLEHPSFSKALRDYLADDSRVQPWFSEPSIGPEEFRGLFLTKRSLVTGL